MSRKTADGSISVYYTVIPNSYSYIGSVLNLKEDCLLKFEVQQKFGLLSFRQTCFLLYGEKKESGELLVDLPFFPQQFVPGEVSTSLCGKGQVVCWCMDAPSGQQFLAEAAWEL